MKNTEVWELTALDWIQAYKSAGFNVIPCRGKTPIVEWGEYTKRDIPPEDILTHLPQSTTIGITQWDVKYAILDVDSPSNLYELDWLEFDRKTLVARTTRGFHIFLRVWYYTDEWGARKELKGKNGRIGELIFKGNVIVPPSELEGVRRLWYYLTPNEALRRWEEGWDEEGLTPEEWLNILEEGAIISVDLRKITEKDVVEVLKRHYKEGVRHRTVLGLAGAMKKAGFDLEETTKVVGELVHETGDEEAKDRLRAVLDTYSKDNVAGYTILQEVDPNLPEELGEALLIKQIEEMSISATDLISLDTPPPVFVVENLIPAGLTVLAGRPKVGKSWFALRLAIHVAHGVPFEGRETKRGKVYYFALEDPNVRLKTRLQMLLKALKLDTTENLKFYHSREPFVLDGRGLRMIEQLAKTHTLIVIDTYIRARAFLKKPKNVADYEFETRILSQLQRIAVENQCAILLIHHTRKGSSEDVFEKILGTTAITGVADTMIVVEKTKGGVKIHVTGRDTEEESLVFEFDPVGEVFFKYKGTAEEVEMTELQKQILEVLTSPRTMKDLMEILQKGKGTIHKALQKLIELGKVVEEIGRNGITVYKRV